MYTHDWQPAPSMPLGFAPFIIPAIGAAGSLASGLMSIFKSKAPNVSAWGWPVDDYATHIMEAEKQIVALRREISKLTGKQEPSYPQSPWPPVPASGNWYKGGSQQGWYDAMRPVVAQYSAQADCVTNNNQVQPGGCYEQTYSAQQSVTQGLMQQLQQAQQSAQQRSSAPVTGSPTAPAPLSYPQYGLTAPPSVTQYPMLTAPPPMPGTYYQSPISPMPSYTMPSYVPPVSSPMPSNISITSPGQTQAPYTDIFAAGLGSWPLLLFGAGALILVLMSGRQSAAPVPARQKIVYRKAPRRDRK